MVNTFKSGDWVWFHPADGGENLFKCGRIVDGLGFDGIRFYITDDHHWYLREPSEIRLMTDGEIMLFMFEKE